MTTARNHPKNPAAQPAPHHPKTKTRHWSNVRGHNNGKKEGK